MPPPRPQFEPPRTGPFGAKRIDFHFGALLLDFEKAVCKTLGQYALVINGRLAQQYLIQESNIPVRIKAYSLIAHCCNWKKKMAGRSSVDEKNWKFIEDLERAAREVTELQVKDLRMDAPKKYGDLKRQDTKKLRRREQFLLLGERVILSENGHTIACGILEEVETRSMWIGGVYCDISPVDLMGFDWKIAKDTGILMEGGPSSNICSTQATSMGTANAIVDLELQGEDSLNAWIVVDGERK